MPSDYQGEVDLDIDDDSMTPLSKQEKREIQRQMTELEALDDMEHLSKPKRAVIVKPILKQLVAVICCGSEPKLLSNFLFHFIQHIDWIA